jgi:hypothetical protein
MAERLRALVERPLGPATGRAIPLLALAVGLGFAVVALLGGIDASAPMHGAATARSPVRRPASSGPSPRSPLIARQDPQDRRGTTAHRLALREVVAHRALQHLPWHRGGVSIELVGAKGAEAVLDVEGPSLLAARRGWSRFLGRRRDDERSYIPRFRISSEGARP